MSNDMDADPRMYLGEVRMTHTSPVRQQERSQTHLAVPLFWLTQAQRTVIEIQMHANSKFVYFSS